MSLLFNEYDLCVFLVILLSCMLFAFDNNISMSRGFLGQNPILYRTVNAQSEKTGKQNQDIDMQAMASELIQQENGKIHDLLMQIRAYQFKIKEEVSTNLDHSAEISELDSQVRACREEEGHILQQIQNCRKVQNQVAPMEYYLWKKKQRVNTYDASIAELCREIQQQRDYLQSSIEQHRRLNEQLLNEIDELEDRIARFDHSPRQSISPAEVAEEQIEELFAQNVTLKEECKSLSSNNPFLQQNVEILEAQIIDNIDSTVSALKTYYQQEKTRLIRQFKQLQAESKTLEVSPLSREQQVYSIQPVLNDYAHKMTELGSLIPQRLRKSHVLVQPLPWKTFKWSQFLDSNSSGEIVYDQYTRLQKEFITNQKQIEQQQLQMRKINSEIANEQQKFNEIYTNISKLKKRLEK